jgi:hypothetical protein
MTISKKSAIHLAGWRFFRKKLSETVEKNVPRCGERTKLKNSWITREILRLIRRKRRKWKEVKNSASAEEMKQYKQLEKETMQKIRNAKRKMEDKKQDNNRTLDHQGEENANRGQRHG